MLLYILFRGTHLLLRVPTCQRSPSSTGLDKCIYFKSFRRHQHLASPPLDQLHVLFARGGEGYTPISLLVSASQRSMKTLQHFHSLSTQVTPK
ncbi:unnamed protein product [Ascophyllum nodosum]